MFYVTNGTSAAVRVGRTMSKVSINHRLQITIASKPVDYELFLLPRWWVVIGSATRGLSTANYLSVEQMKEWRNSCPIVRNE